MGFNFGGAVIDFDFRTVVDELLEPEDRPFISDHETPEARQQKTLMEVGTLALRLIGYSANVGDAHLEFIDAASASFDQETPEMVGRLAQFSRERGAVLVFWFNDTTDTYMFSVFRDGARVRFRSTGPGLSDDEGAPVPGEPSEPCHGHDHQMGVLEAFVGRSFGELVHVQMERFDEP